jgi:hypothetical protein
MPFFVVERRGPAAGVWVAAELFKKFNSVDDKKNVGVNGL